ncbi:filament-like plant protein 7 isoform X2 [Trifolium pratense]|uniref:filament-like plant protein 7 isoform X2 n=1 Tax=Trifolium pratense TaxID=57577 RepID=UPI001E691B44|nr:filament-like plant protein 7 isoform X2 [Trifolium pratense]XP_045813406.1 filament-like plant protein 7 isoform X2 [Trifolium pratense]
MNHKPWHWRKKSMEKTSFSADKIASPSQIIDKEAHNLSTDKESGSRISSSRCLNENLAKVLLDSPVGVDKEVSTETVTPTDETLQEPLQTLSCVRGEQEQTACVVIPNISKEHEMVQKELEEKLKEANKRIDDLTSENTCLTNALFSKEESIGELLRCKQEADEELKTLMTRLDSTEKENAFLRYEFQMLEKELEIRKEEIDYSRQYADESHKQYLESSQKVSKLEGECQRLRLQLQKRSPGVAGSMNTKNEIGMMRRKKSNPTRDVVCKNNDIRNSTRVSEKSIGLMIKSLQDLDEENKALKRILTKKNTELDSSRFMYTETVSRLSQAEILLRKFSENHKSMELARCYPKSNELPLMSNFDISSDDEAKSSGSWANALISELEHLRVSEAKTHDNNKAIEVHDMYSMDDFVEMEKRAIVSVNTPKEGYLSDVSGRELVPVEQDFGLSERNQKPFDWLQNVLQAMLKEKRLSKRSLDELFDDIKIAFGCINHSTGRKSDITQKSIHHGESDPFHVNSFGDFTEAVNKIIKLVEGIAPKSFFCNNGPDCLEENQHSDISQSPKSKDYFVHVFQWKVSDLNPLLHQLVHTCKNLLTGKADFENFVEEVAFALEWSINNCANSNNASIARDKIKKHFNSFLSANENENQIDVDDKQSLGTNSVAYPNDQSDSESNRYDFLVEIRKLKEDLTKTKSAKEDLEVKLLSVTDESQNLTKQCHEAQNSIKGLESEIETLKESKAMVEEQVEKQMMINEDLDTQLTIAQAKLNSIFQKFSSLEFELEDKKNSCEELEATCLELQLQLESIAKKESPTNDRCEAEKIYRTGWEITTASSKLAECQESIINIGKQLKALASSNETALLDKVVSTTSSMAIPSQKKNLIKRTSLRNQMLAEDDGKEGTHESIETKESKNIEVEQRPALLLSEKESALETSQVQVNGPETSMTSEKNNRSNAIGYLTIVPHKKQGGFDFLRKLFSRRKKGRSRGTRLLAKA